MRRNTVPQGGTVFPECKTEPGFRLTEVIDEFYQQGVVPDFLPADLGTDEASEVDNDGWFEVDPKGNLRYDKFAEYNQALFDGTYDPESTTVVSAFGTQKTDAADSSSSDNFDGSSD